MYMDCYKLPPAHMLIFNLNNRRIIEIRKYWKLHVNTTKGRRRKEKVLCDELRSILSKSVQKNLVADVAVGCLLSGGVDSSIIAYECNHYNPSIHTYTIGFEEKKYDESTYADIMIKKYHLNCTTQIINHRDINKIKKELRKWYDEPFADTSAYPSYIVSALARQDVKVVLTGDGGDELFGGYNRYSLYSDSVDGKWLDSEIVSKIGKRTEFDQILTKKQVQKYINTGLENYIPYILMTEKSAVELYRKKWNIGKDYDPYWHLKKYYIKELPCITRARYLDFKTYLSGDILTKVDRVSMANSLEARVPFLGKEVIEFAFSLSEEECCTSNTLKRILKNAYIDMIPNEILYRKKRGFSVPPNYFVARKKNIPITYEILSQEWKNLI